LLSPGQALVISLMRAVWIRRPPPPSVATVTCLRTGDRGKDHACEGYAGACDGRRSGRGRRV